MTNHKPPQYFRDKGKKNYRLDKELSKRYQRGLEVNAGETFSQFKKRVKKKQKRISLTSQMRG